MEFLGRGLIEALHLLISGDAETLHAILVSLTCTVTAVGLATLLAVPYGAWLGLYSLPGRRLQVFGLRVAMSVPTVVIGLVVFAFFSRRGLLGELDLLYTRTAITLGEFLLAFPLLGSLAYGATVRLESRLVETALTLGASRSLALFKVLGEVRPSLVAALLATFGRCVTELGIALTVGGNLAFRTRTLPATTQLELSRGRFAAALAPGILLLLMAAAVVIAAQWLEREDRP
ncbi:MAG: ABC transporter permease [Acidobacteriota bacterium]